MWGAGREPAAATAAGGTVAAGQAAGSIHSRRKVMIKFILADKKKLLQATSTVKQTHRA